MSDGGGGDVRGLIGRLLSDGSQELRCNPDSRADVGLVANLNFERIGYPIVAIFLVCWLSSTVTCKPKRYDALEAIVPTGE
jgi:hypothetical protein